MSKLSKYTKDLGECLKKESVEELDKFFAEHTKDIGEDVCEQWKVADPLVKKITLYKMIYNRIDLPKELRIKAKVWLVSRGLSLNI